jgi:predicted MFS family arabinose efflux permease
MSGPPPPAPPAAAGEREKRTGALNPPILLLALAAFTVGAGMRILDPLLPMLAREFGVGLGAVAPLIGGFALAYGLGQLAAGPLGDRLGKLRVAAVAMALYAGTLLAASLAGDLTALIVIRLLSGLAAAATIPLFMAHIGDSVAYAERQATLGRFLTGMVMANLLAGPVSGIVAELAGWRASFLVLGSVGALITAVFVLRLGAVWRQPLAAGRGGGLGGFVPLFTRPAPRRLMLAAMADGLLWFGGAFPFIASLLIETFGLSAATAGLVAACFGLGALAYTRLAPRLVRHFGERGLALRGGLGLAFSFVVIAVAPEWWIIAPVIAATGLLFFMVHGVLQARATEALPEARGTAVAGFAMALFLGQSIGAVLFGVIIAGAGYRTALLTAAAGTVGVAFALRRWVIPPA